jgi:succinate dehydrogenase/fumarate reductase cytochrome b subunit
MKTKLKSKMKKIGFILGGLAGGVLAFFLFKVVPYGATILGFDVSKTDTMYQALKWINDNPNGFIHPLAGVLVILATIFVGGLLGLFIEKQLK